MNDILNKNNIGDPTITKIENNNQNYIENNMDMSSDSHVNLQLTTFADTIESFNVTDTKNLEIPVSKPQKINTQEELNEIIQKHNLWLESVLNPFKKIISGRANLHDSKLHAVDLRGVNLSGATLINIEFSNSDLSNANFTGADLSYSCFKETKINGAIFKKANLNYTIFENTELTEEQLKSAKSTYKIKR